MKKYYTVKETSQLLGVSTNTVYSYLQEGKLEAKRIGKGRFKIPYRQILPYIETGKESFEVQENLGSGDNVNLNANFYQTPADNETDNGYPVELTNLDENTSEMVNEQPLEISPGVKDIVFFRIFKGVAFLGLGIINLYTLGTLLSPGDVLLGELGGFLLKVLPYGLIFIGLFSLAEIFKPKRFSKFHLFIDGLSSIILGYSALLSFISGNYNLFIITTAFCGIAIGHLISGIKTSENTFTFLNTYTRLLLYIGLLGGATLIIYPNIMPIEIIGNYVNLHRELSAFIYFVIVVVPLIYILTPSGKKSTIRLPYFVFASTLSIIVAIELTFIGSWDISYITFLIGIFGLFLAWWIESRKVLDAKKIFVVFLSFIWISASFIFGLFALKTSHEEIKTDAHNNMQETLEQLVAKINTDFESRNAVLTTFAGSENVKVILNEGKQDEAILVAKTIYDRLGTAERVLIYNKEGVAIGVYPRNTLSQGTNFSSQEYFQNTVKTYKGFVSPVFENILGNPSIIHTEPIFKNNEFIGMLGASLALDKLAEDYQVGTTLRYSLEATDNNGVIVFSLTEDKIGQKGSLFNNPQINKQIGKDLIVTQEAQTPKWNVTISTSLAPLVSKISGMNVILSMLLIANAVFSVAAGIVAASKREISSPKVTPMATIQQLTHLSQKPRFI